MGWLHRNVLPKPPGHLPMLWLLPQGSSSRSYPSQYQFLPCSLGACAQQGDIKQDYSPSLVKVLGCEEQGQGTPVVMTTCNFDHTRQCLNICELIGLSAGQP